MKKILILFLVAMSTQASFAQDNRPILNVKGVASVSVKPTLAVISYNVQTTQSTYVTALEDMTKRIDLLANALKDLRFKDEDIVTSTFQVNKNVYWDNGQQKHKGYTATQTLRVAFDHSKERLLKVLNKTINSQANAEINISFDLDDKRKAELKNELIKAAVRDARQKAELIANEAGYSIDGIREINYSDAPYNPNPGPVAYRMSKESLGSADVEMSNMEASSLNFSDQISAVFYLKVSQ